MLIAFLVSLLAGLATIVGGVIATNKRFLERSYFAAALAFAAGAMLFISFVELLPHGLGSHTTHQAGGLEWGVYGAFFAGMLLVALIGRFLPASLNPSEVEGTEDRVGGTNTRLLRSGLVVAVVLALHNFPEGLSTFLATYEDLSVGLALAIAIAVHNIPEGIAVAAPIYAATKSRKRAIAWATVSGLAEPAGALVGFLLLGAVIPPQAHGVIFGLVAGMMVFVAIDELLPAARRYQTNQHQVVYGMLAGMMVSAVSLLLF